MLRSLWERRIPPGSQADFARCYGLNDRQLSQMLNGYRPLNLEYAVRLSDYLGTELAKELWENFPRLLRERSIALEAGRIITTGRVRGVPVVELAEPGPDGRWVAQTVRGIEGRVMHDSTDSRAYAVKILGSNLAPRIKPGEYVVAEPGRAVSPGDEVLIQLKDGSKMVLEFLFERDGRRAFDQINGGGGRLEFDVREIQSMHYVAGIARPGQYQKP